MDLLLISDGSWLVPLTAEKATLAPAARTDIPNDEVTPPSADGFESHTTKHFPSKTTGSVWFCPRENATPNPRRRAEASTAKDPGSLALNMTVEDLWAQNTNKHS